jgi:hypothetical protein
MALSTTAANVVAHFMTVRVVRKEVTGTCE